MDSDRFDTLTRILTNARSRRRVLAVAFGAALVPLLAQEDTAAHALSRKCKKLKGVNKKKCLKKAKAHAAQHASDTPRVTCTPSCGGKTCGPDGCSGSCGPCSNGTCTAGACVCSGGTELCGGECVDPCTGSAVRHPTTCGCCGITPASCSAGADCCSGLCPPPFGGGPQMCQGRTRGAACEFAGQCESQTCTNSTCVCRSGEVPCADAFRCAAPCSEGRFFVPNTNCACCIKNQESCAGRDFSCCAGENQCVSGICQGLPDGRSCHADVQCASTSGCNMFGRCGELGVG